MLDDNRPLYSIGMAAELLNVHPRTLRLYEQGGLLRPARRNNRRFYSNNDLKWINSIRYLIHERGLNQEGLRRLLALIPCWEITDCPSKNCQVYVWEVTSQTLLFTLTGHSYDVLGLAFNSDGKVLVSASSDQTIRLWDVETGALFRTLWGHTEEITGVTFLLDGCLLASSSGDNSVRLWCASGKVPMSTVTPASPPPVDLEPIIGANASQLMEVGILRYNEVGKIATSLDGRRLAVQSDQGIHLYDVQTMEETSLLKPSQPTTSLALSPEAETLASGDRHGNIYLWDLESGLQLRTLEGHTAQLNSLAFNSDGLKLASGGDDKTVQLWEVASGRRITTFGPLEGVVKSAVFSPDGKLIAAIDGVRAIKLWDVENGTLARELERDAGEFANHSLAFSADGRLLAAGGRDSRTCPAYLNRNAPCWQIVGETGDQSKECFQCRVYLSARERICQEEELEATAAFEV